MARKNEGKAKKPAKFTPCYIPCRIEPGMFREEFLVYLDAIDPSDPNKKVKAQLFVDQREVAGVSGAPKRHNPAPAWLRVTLVAEQGEWAEVVLPQPSQPLGERILIASESVREKPGL
ncbi:MAG TPA: hypothetical protein VMS17_32750 [Gemmataceae bacterium]|nr:hypothetical protein [Gemmataceae bacterium]